MNIGKKEWSTNMTLWEIIQILMVFMNLLSSYEIAK